MFRLIWLPIYECEILRGYAEELGCVAAQNGLTVETKGTGRAVVGDTTKGMTTSELPLGFYNSFTLDCRNHHYVIKIDTVRQRGPATVICR